MVSLMKRSFSGHFELALDKEKNAAALEEWTKSRTGLYTSFFGSSGMIFGKTESTYETEAFKALDADTQDFLRKPGVPNWEIVFVRAPLPATWNYKLTSTSGRTNSASNLRAGCRTFIRK